jgi:heptaprenyl diphosphate synthase
MGSGSPNVGSVNIGELVSLPELRSELARVDALLRSSVAVADDQVLTDAATHLIAAGGKRLRPTLAVAAAMAGVEGPVPESVIEGAAAVELVHLGSLYHDDVLDGATTRRAVPTVNSKWNNFIAIIAGDYLLARASSLAARLGVEVTALLADTIAELCMGQAREQRDAFSLERSIEGYEACIDGKTASLLATSARIGAIAADLPRDQVDALTNFARNFGMAFQIRDDLLDIMGTDEELGKPAGNDLVEGVYTLPVIYAMREPVIGDEIRGLLGGPIDTPERDKARDLVRSSNGVKIAEEAGREWASKATAELAVLPNSPMKERFIALGNALF